MIAHRNYEVYGSVIFYIIIKILCAITNWYHNMYRKQPTLTSIPERNENEDDYGCQKWVPKKKHEVLKAKYKCLKKLFQIYDASVIGILPETYATEDSLHEDTRTERRRKRRSHRTKTDACAGTTEISSGDISNRSETEKDSIATDVIRDLKVTEYSRTITQVESIKDVKTSTVPSKLSMDTKEIMAVEKECGSTQTADQHPIPYLMVNEKRRPTRFQCFIQRIFGIKSERSYKNYVLPNGHVYAASDNNISHNCEKRRRKGLRFRRLRRPKKIQSEIMLRDMNSPVILTYVQSVQRNCLMDTTARQCPIVGCRMISYGIINYNDHLNLCHFINRKYICHYCHEGFEREHDKLIHENEHIGITKLNTNISLPSSTRDSFKIASNTQTDPEFTRCDVTDDKIKKIVSFFDKISDPDSILNEIKKGRSSESNLQSKTETETIEGTSDSDNRTVSCVNLRKKEESSADSEVTSHPFGSPVVCHYCGENFNYRRQLSLHVDLEHRVHNKFSKFHSCAGILTTRPSNRTDMVSEDGQIRVQSIDRSLSGIHRISSPSTQDSYSDISRRKSEESLSCDPSTNIVYYTSMESVRKPSVVNSFVQKVRSIGSYKWEPGTKIIRV